MTSAASGVVFVGVARMGALMAERLFDAGVPLAVADLSQEALAPFAARGLPVARHAADLQGDVVMTMLPTGAHVRAALLGEGGACSRLQRAAVIDMSTASPEETVVLSADLALVGTALIDAPVSGGMAGARAGTLMAMAGGDVAQFQRYRPLLMHFCRDAARVGPVGAGHIVKALNNFLSAVTLWSTAEALEIGTRLGLDPAAMLAVWTKGTGRSHASEVKLPNHVLNRRFDFGQTLDLFCKDIGIAAELAVRTGVVSPAMDATLANWQALRDTLGGGEDITVVAKLIEASKR